ncbi:putative hd domain-containing protein [Botrytis fragariae]|uniref:Putative hd domain-containing protein n=1 Tax=Botrytis fragariae TaxID=1964551 RepID=A0A8H6ELZ9_9HELO|nr:putative hd domain-containing protein [Botrytis fragariae]KAF5877064.1 putative hd domain-containing protein [Botrytis fragariae]
MPPTLSPEELLEQHNGTPEINSTSRKPGRPPGVSLEPYKDLIVKLFAEENTPIIDITRKLNRELGLDVSERKVSRSLAAWNIRKRNRGPIPQALQDRLTYHYNSNLNDDQITQALISEGFEIKRSNLGRLRQKLGMRRRSRYSEFREYSEGPAVIHSPSSHLPSTITPNPNNTKPKMAQNAGLIVQVTAFVEKYMSAYDGSHDFNHIRRVVGLAHRIYKELKAERIGGPDLDLQVVTLAALLHDVGDKKYLLPGQDPNTLVLSTLLSFGADEKLAVKVQRIVLGVSYSSEIKDMASVRGMIEKYPELAVVQDADRLDAIGKAASQKLNDKKMKLNCCFTAGAIGIGRTFTFGGAKGARDMGETIQHFEDKLEKLGEMMKTAPGKRMAEERTKRLATFKDWWEEEQQEAEGLLRPQS